ncbi:ATP-dependent zinc metalloprotease FTSH 5, mitochondrial [Grifola frondosa]|uniref:ATP-dependent zinc metalloprotease FTSH 5, mitochondrial n=1 Tax=Grifola frondosa TaxID=5627 RepID=A0A1C7MEW1_GRIFR|nr:ATP-dependent zinc metalloprotease FTSH 5, mitochondrial [Grifola frondosa]
MACVTPSQRKATTRGPAIITFPANDDDSSGEDERHTSARAVDVALIGIRTPRPLIHSLFQYRSLSTTTLSLLRFPVPLHRTPILVYSRSLSLGSIFSPRKPFATATPPPAVVANIATLEADANVHPNDAQKQLALFEALVNTKVKPGYDVVIARWERMCEFDPSSPLLRSDAAFQLYLTALHENGLESSINSAVRRRDALLAGTSAVLHLRHHPRLPLHQRTLQLRLWTLLRPWQRQIMRHRPRPIRHFRPVSHLVNYLRKRFWLDEEDFPQAHLIQIWPSLMLHLKSESEYLEILLLLRSLNQRAHGFRGLSGFLSLLRLPVSILTSPLVILVVLAVLLENSGLMKAGPRQAEFEAVQSKTYKFSDVQGVDEAKEELQEVVEFLKDPTSFATLGGKLPKGILLTGPPGTGKTMLARAVAGEAGVPFLFASGSEFDEMFVGVGAKRVRDLFATARKKQPAIIFIDELDAIGGKRTSRDQHYMKQTLNQLLVEMDGFLQTEGVIVIAATNFPDSLDPALVRPGRFDRHIAVPLPDVRGRVQILKHHMKNVITAPEVDTAILARGTVGFSGADLQNMVNQAAVQASREGAKAVNLKHFEWAKDRIIMGAERKSTYISDEVKRMTAYHEVRILSRLNAKVGLIQDSKGGHALVALYTDGAMPLHKVTCVPRGHALGITSQLPEDDRYSVSLKQYLATIDVCMGGRVAEELIYGPENVTSGASSDLQQATRTARAMVKNWGYSDKIGPVYYNDREESISPQKKDEIEGEVRSLLIAGESRVTSLLKSKEEELHRLASALIEHETLDAEEVKKVIKGEPIRNITEVIQEDLSRMTENSL